MNPVVNSDNGWHATLPRITCANILATSMSSRDSAVIWKEFLILLRIQVEPHWLNGWFMRLFSKPAVIVDGKEYAATFSQETLVDVETGVVEIGAGIRYFSRGALLGFVPEKRRLDDPDQTYDVTLRNGFWNHSPFRILSCTSQETWLGKFHADAERLKDEDLAGEPDAW